jgi:hypothetical protein
VQGGSDGTAVSGTIRVRLFERLRHDGFRSSEESGEASVRRASQTDGPRSRKDDRAGRFDSMSWRPASSDTAWKRPDHGIDLVQPNGQDR